MSQQRRPLSAMTSTSTGITAPVAVAATATTVHVVDNSNPTNYLDQVTLYVTNNHTAAQVATISVLGVSIAISIAANSTVLVLDGQPLFSAPGASTSASSITVTNTTNTVADSMRAFGFFTR